MYLDDRRAHYSRELPFTSARHPTPDTNEPGIDRQRAQSLAAATRLGWYYGSDLAGGYIEAHHLTLLAVLAGRPTQGCLRRRRRLLRTPRR
jgi:hypothetical protein